MLKKGFTLAEVLITIGVIGIVAALTIPALYQNHQKKVLVNQLKTTIAILQQGFKLAMADDNSSGDLRGTELFAACDGDKFEGAYLTAEQEWADSCFPVMQKYFKGLKWLSVKDMYQMGDTTNIITDTAKCKKLVGVTNKWWYLNDHTKCRGWKNMSVTLMNGAKMDILFSDGNGAAGAITSLDVNGAAGPNTWGRDTFYLMIMNDGTVTPWGTKYYAETRAKYENDMSKVDSYLLTDYDSFCSDKTTEEGSDCATRIINDGWVMKY